jgi:hypothetical protein
LGVSQDLNQGPRLGRRIASAALAGLGLLVALAGVAIVRNECEVACGTATDHAFRESMGYVALVLGAVSIPLAFRGRRGVAAAVSSVGAIACVAAFLEAVSHLS